MTPTEQQLQIALTRALPLRFFSDTEFGKYTVLRWQESRQAVTPHEWNRIVGMVEEKLQDGIFEDYVKILKDLYLNKSHGFSSDGAITATWEERAQAFAVIGAITIEEQP